MTARIYRPAKNAMQSGRGKSSVWLLEFEPSAPRVADPLTGWSGTTDVSGPVRLRFASQEAAEAYANANGIAYHVAQSHEPKRIIRAYTDNFAFSRREPWSH